ncbi:mercuric reductase [Microlunatus soli]|uniref:Pyruvate/2-oxoglutarate dehydrogenase complex, dihydrolipoamide dehydrogenase (E3) component n=1 Tax=Microlunatus soli TaxID=630515 RepID=A0A1H1VAC5_9ACTN|nr:mercuric reductase [Microlunatus soli]SDS81704.1 Pyruvate/2-oxoglutarate dehydrogenase complex, dihydrolipoamide dehydrogenase (E3) component [Microlunatus soli]
MERFDAIVIGAGQAGPGVAGELAGNGRKVALIEYEQVGGTCLNHGCRPTKALRASAVAAHSARRAADFGVRTGEVRVDFPAVMQRMHTMIDSMRSGLSDWLDSLPSLEVIHQTARLISSTTGDHRVIAGDRELSTPEVYLDLGARAAVPPIPGLDEVDHLTEVELLQLTELPAELIVIGGSYIGCEFGQMFGRFGSRVTIIGSIAPREDPDVSSAIKDLLTGEGVRVVEARAEKVARDGDRISVSCDDGSIVTGSQLLIAAGRRPNIDLLGEDHGLEIDDRGFIAIDSRFATSVPGVWALGDINGHGAFTHTAYQDSQILLDPERTVDGRITAYAMFTDPPLGRVGMTQAEARSSGRRVLQAEVPMSSVSRAVLDSETIGLMRVLVDGDTEEVLGATFFGMHGDDLVQQLGLAMQAGVRYPQLRDALPIHPTVAEFIPTLMSSLTEL